MGEPHTAGPSPILDSLRTVSNNPPGRAGVYLGWRRVYSGYGPEAPMAC